MGHTTAVLTGKTIHVIPVMDVREHATNETSSTCSCGAECTKTDKGTTVVEHRSFFTK